LSTPDASRVWLCRVELPRSGCGAGPEQLFDVLVKLLVTLMRVGAKRSRNFRWAIATDSGTDSEAGISGNLTSGYPREEVPGQWLDAEYLDSSERPQVALSWTGACDIVRRE